MASCNCMKDRHYKSSLQLYNASAQTIGTAMAPIALSGSDVTDTGVSLGSTANAVEILHSGLYRITADIGLNVTTAGDITVQMYQDGVPMPETARIITASTGYHTVSIDTVRRFGTFCGQNPVLIQLMAMTDGTAVGSVSLVSVNALKEA